MTASPAADRCAARARATSSTSVTSRSSPTTADLPTLSATGHRRRVAQHFGSLVTGPVERYLAPNVWALKFVLHGALGGGASAGLRSDGQGKTHGLALLRLWVDVPDAVAERATRPRHPESTGP